MRSKTTKKSLCSDQVWFTQVDAPWIRALSTPEHRIHFEHDVKIPMRDGTRLSANIWRPTATGRFPVVFIFTPYDNAQDTWVIERVQYFVPRGYVVAAVDVRGRYDSEGTSYLYWSTDWKEGRFDGEDTYDCQTWLGERPWSSGRIGMTGGSYLAFVQWMSAPFQNPYLKALIPWISPDDHYDNVYPNGAMQLSNSLNLLAYLGTGTRDIKEGLRKSFWDWPALYRHLPLRTMDVALYGHSDQLWQDFVDHPDNDVYWRFSIGVRPGVAEMGSGRYARVRVPTLNITGWYDQVAQATINNYLGMTRFGPEDLRHTHHLVVGPWRHSSNLPRCVGETDFGLAAEVNYLRLEHRWFDYWLKGIENGVMDEPPVSIFTMGANVWRTEPEWPVHQSSVRPFYLLREADNGGTRGVGHLADVGPASGGVDCFDYDPADPVPSLGGNVSMYPMTNTVGPVDQRPLHQRNDVLIYTTAPQGEALEVTGRILVKLYAATSAPDTDFTAKLSDVHPDGAARILCEGIIRGRYRRAFHRQELLDPERTYEFTIDLWSISHVFLPGHRLQVEISSSNFPKYDRNPNTGHRFGEDAELAIAHQTVYWGGDRPSRIELPVVTRR
jgi:hypothetical protein